MFDRSSLQRPPWLSLVLPLPLLAIPLYADLYERLLYRRPVPDNHRFDHLVETKGGVAAVTRDGVVYGGGVYDGRISIDFVDDVNGIFRPFSISAFHPAPRRVLMIGLSAGAWAEVVANHPQLDELVVVEINPGYLKLIPRYRVVAGVLANSRVKIVIDDGRRWLRNYRGQGFDVVIMNTTFHWRSCASNVLLVGCRLGNRNTGGERWVLKVVWRPGLWLCGDGGGPPI